MSGPRDDRVQDHRGSVDDGEFVEAGRDAAPLLEVAEPAFDHVAASVVGRVERRWPATTCAASATVPGLVVGFGDDCADPAASQQFPVGAGRVGLVAADPVRAGTGSPTTDPWNLQVVE